MMPPVDVHAAVSEAGAHSLMGTDAAVLQAATARMKALGIDGKAALVTRDPHEMMAFLGVEEDRCATSS